VRAAASPRLRTKVSLTRAREKARRARDALAVGLDPIEQKRADRTAAIERKAPERSEREAEALTLCRVARAYDHHLERLVRRVSSRRYPRPSSPDGGPSLTSPAPAASRTLQTRR
jgi:hypothetical protein